MRITWYVDDGYAGSRQAPHTVEVDDEDLIGQDDETRKQIVEDVIADAFQDSVRWFYDEPDWSELPDEEEE